MISLFNPKRKAGIPPRTVEQVDVARYCGTWYEISSIPAKRQRNCTKTRLFSADYLVIDLADDYSWAVVSNRSASALWILSRTPYMHEGLYETILGRLRERGIDSSRLMKTVQ